MSDVVSYFNKLKDNAEVLRKTVTATEWEIDRIKECLEGLFTFAKFQEGEIIEMANTYPVNSEDSWGWMVYRHLLTKGSKATIRQVSYYNKTFQYQIEFLEQTWIDDKNKIHPDGSSALFTLTEVWLKKSKPKKCWLKKLKPKKCFK